VTARLTLKLLAQVSQAVLRLARALRRVRQPLQELPPLWALDSVLERLRELGPRWLLEVGLAWALRQVPELV